ncbi:MAG: trypsin-like peptidase domain-containing protein [Anaerolineales bacterium]|nr:trypsin-like peptidase domain-containing protein [Anaerolineales bacterium]
MKFYRLASILLVFMLAAMACQIPELTLDVPVTTPAQPADPAVNPAPPVVSFSDPEEQQDLYTALYESVSPGIVSIQVETDLGSSQGSGFVYDQNGHVITNYHVVEGAKAVQVSFMSGFKAYGTVIGADLDSDIAVIKVDAPADKLHPLRLGDSDTLKVGQGVVALGNPFGLNGTMTTGIISALGRTLASGRTAPGGGFFSSGDIIQTDAAINPGNSGGPLFNLQGDVIGVNRAIRTTNFTSSGDPLSSGIGFAISINIVKRVVPVLISEGKYSYPYIGIASIDNLDLKQLELLGLDQFTGVYVVDVTAGGPADLAGLQAGHQETSIQGLYAGGDLIIALDGQAVNTYDDLIKILVNTKVPGDQVVVTVLRDGEQIEMTVTLGERP